MKAKTARRFLTRNQWKMAMHQGRITRQSPSFAKRYKKCISVVIKAEDKL